MRKAARKSAQASIIIDLTKKHIKPNPNVKQTSASSTPSAYKFVSFTIQVSVSPRKQNETNIVPPPPRSGTKRKLDNRDDDLPAAPKQKESKRPLKKQKTKQHEYICWQIAKKLPDATEKDASIELIAYKGFSYWVCPNPEDVECANDLKSQYQQGHFLSQVKKRITRKDFENDAIWN